MADHPRDGTKTPPRVVVDTTRREAGQTHGKQSYGGDAILLRGRFVVLVNPWWYSSSWNTWTRRGEMRAQAIPASIVTDIEWTEPEASD